MHVSESWHVARSHRVSVSETNHYGEIHGSSPSRFRHEIMSMCVMWRFSFTQSQTRRGNLSLQWVAGDAPRPGPCPMSSGSRRRDTTQSTSSRRDAPHLRGWAWALASLQCRRVLRAEPDSKPNRHDAPDRPRHVARPNHISAQRTSPESRRSVGVGLCPLTLPLCDRCKAARPGCESACSFASYVGLHFALLRARARARGHSAPVPSASVRAWRCSVPQHLT
jgi:hypothetical protein